VLKADKVESTGMQLLPFIMKVMVWFFVIDTDQGYDCTHSCHVLVWPEVTQQLP
jgi:hypothetical protein